MHGTWPQHFLLMLHARLRSVDPTFDPGRGPDASVLAMAIQPDGGLLIGGSFTNVKGRVQRFVKAIEPPGEARPEWEFLHELVHHVTGQNGFSTIEGLFNQMAAEVPGFAGLEWAKLGDTGVTVQI